MWLFVFALTKEGESAMKVVCPTCNTIYNIKNGKIPQGKRASALCKKCGGKFIIDPTAKTVEPEDFRFETSSKTEEIGTGSHDRDISLTGPELGRTNVLFLIFLTVITLGVYYPIWFLRKKDALNKLQAKEKLGSGLFIFITIVQIPTIFIGFTIGFLEGFTGEEGIGKGFDLLTKLLSLAVGIIFLAKSLKVRRILKGHFGGHLGYGISFSPLATFFFQIYYLQYKINRLPPPTPPSSGLIENTGP